MGEQPLDDNTAVYEACLDEIHALIDQQIHRQPMNPKLYGELWRSSFAAIIASVIRKEGMLPSEIDAYLRLTFDRIRTDVLETVREWDEHSPTPPPPE